jgi:parallel beta-helix repeat protein
VKGVLLNKVILGFKIAFLLTSIFTFNIKPAKAMETIYIRVDGSVDPPTAPIQRSGNLYTLTDNIFCYASGIEIERDGIILDGMGYLLQGSSFYVGNGVSVNERNEVTIRNMRIKNFSYGIYVGMSYGITIQENNIMDIGAGITLEGSTSNVIFGNSVIHSVEGIRLFGSDNNYLSLNIIQDSYQNGILVYYSSNNHIDSNSIINSGLVTPSSYGNIVNDNTVNGKPLIYLEDASDYVVQNAGQVILVHSNNITVENLALSNTNYAIQLWGTQNSTIVGNTLKNNRYALLLDASSKNKFYHNIFEDNSNHLSISSSKPNVWDDGYPSGGNYWSDYVGVDFYSGPSQNEIGSDGIGDTPYIINDDNMDRYPLFQDGPSETLVVNLVNGLRAYNWDLELENIALSHPDFRSAGSIGANETANLIKEKFESFGLDAWLEPFQFTNWSLLSKPSLIIDEDGNKDTTNDQNVIGSFQCEHYSWPTSEDGIFADLVILPLPSAANYTELGKYPIDTSIWDTIDTTGKIVLIGREVRWASNWWSTFSNKIFAETPAAIIYTWWYSWMNFTPPMHASAGGKPLFQCYYWNLGIPSGFVNYWDGLLIRQLEGAQASVSANVTVKSVIGDGVHYNVVGKIAGFEHPEKLVIISGHYDTVMCNGFCDNGAGTAGVIELARVFAEAVEKNYYQPNYTLLFVCFTGEEIGLVGSANFVKQHKSEMANIVAVINLDSIGSDDLHVSDTPGSDLRQTIMDAAMNLGIAINLETPGGSDQESFRDPSTINDWVLAGWGVDLGISDADLVESSAILVSFPLLYSDLWNMGTPGWIHTTYDNSTSTETLSWVEPEDLGNHIKVAALTIMRVSPDTSSLIDVALLGVASSKTVVGQGYAVSINVTVENQGGYAETFNVTVYANTTSIATQTVTLTSGNSTTITFTWNTTGFAKGNYTINACAQPLLGETATEDNYLANGEVYVGIPGDVNGDKKVDLKDVYAVGKAYGSIRGTDGQYWHSPPRACCPHSPNCDINDDGKIDLKDYYIVCKNYGKTDP